ncbi:MAG: hypothetical protein AB1668_02310 [Nanoarchaeota archaeon]
MEETVLAHTEIQLLDNKYLVYLKEVPTRLAIGGAVERTAVKAFVKRLNLKNKI